MTYTIFEHQNGRNETDDIAPGRGGYSTVIIEKPPEKAVEWWESEFGKDPGRTAIHSDGIVWSVSEAHTEEDARKHCGKMELDQGGIGSPMKRLYSWDELRGRLDVWVVEEEYDD